MYAKLRNYDFYKDRIHYFGQIISDKGISVDPKKIKAMISWTTPRKVTHIWYFVGLAGYCRRFTKGYFVGKVESMYRLRKPACELVVSRGNGLS